MQDAMHARGLTWHGDRSSTHTTQPTPANQSMIKYEHTADTNYISWTCVDDNQINQY